MSSKVINDKPGASSKVINDKPGAPAARGAGTGGAGGSGVGSKAVGGGSAKGAGAAAGNNNDEAFDPASLIVSKPPSGLSRLLSPIYKGYVQPVVDKLRKKKMLNEKRMLRKEEQMKQDVERILMEIEEQHSWVALGELRARNLSRLQKLEVIDAVKRKEKKKASEEHALDNIEQGLSFKLGNVDKFSKWQNSSSKFQDVAGHKDTVFSVRLSPCLKYIISASGDCTASLWCIEEGKARYPVLTYEGHAKKVIDADFHKNFHIDYASPTIITGSGDGTIKFWNTLREKPVLTVEAHNEAIYKCRFAPCGTRVLSCSEDKTVKLWAFPEGFCLFTYKGHESGVTSASFSPTGRWLVSGSDYGERKIFLWDANMPYFDKPTQYPHQLFWTPEGLLRKILIRQRKPTPYFWLTTDQIQLLGERAKVESWTGQYDEIEVADESEDDEGNGEEEDKIMVDTFGKDDVREFKGASLQVFYTDRDNKTTLASEYMPGGMLSICVDCSDVQISQAFLSVTALNTAYDTFVEGSGQRLGSFIVSYPLPWQMDTAKIDVLGIRKPERIGNDVPYGLTQVDNDQALTYRNKEPVCDEDGVVIEEFSSKFGVVWFCPAPEMGPARVTLTFRFQKTETWNYLTYSLKESPIRVASALTGGNGEAVVQYTFDQVARHNLFFSHIREKNWDAVQSFIDKKAVMYKDKVLKKRRWRIMDALEDIFQDANAVVLPTPVVFKAGQTRSSVLMEYQPYFYRKRPKEHDSDAESDIEDGAHAEPEDANEDGAANGPHVSPTGADGNAASVKAGNSKTKGDAEEQEDEDDEEDGDGDEEENGEKELTSPRSASNDIDEDEGGATSGKKSPSAHKAVPGLILPPAQGGDVRDKYRLDGDKEEDDDIALLSPVAEGEERADDGGGIQMVSTGRKEQALNGAEGSSSGSGQREADVGSDKKGENGAREMPPAGSLPEDISARGKDDVRDAGPVSPKARHSDDVLADPSTSALNDTSALAAVLATDGMDESSLGSLDSSQFSLEKVESLGPDEDDDLLLVRPKTRRQHIKEFMFAGETEGKHFAHEVESMTNQELFGININKFSGVRMWREIRRYASDPEAKEELLCVPGVPHWVRKVEFTRFPERLSDSNREGYYDLLQHPFVKSTLFGPDILQFSMPLPDIYPRKAGRSVNAFTMQLTQYEAARRRTDANAIPTTAAEVEGVGDDHAVLFGHKSEFEKQKEIADIVRQEVALHLLSKRAYLATRRNCLPMLPGMEPHYPNPNYLEPCIDHPFMPLKKAEKSMFSRMRLTDFQDSKVVPPVGRRSTYPEFYHDVEGYLRKKAEEARAESRRLFGAKKGEPDEVVGGDGPNPHVKSSDEGAEAAKAAGSESAAHTQAAGGADSRPTSPSEQHSLTKTEAGEGHAGHAHETGEEHHDHEEKEEDQWDEFGRLIKKKHKKHKKKKSVEVEHEEIARVEEVKEAEDPAALASRLKHEAESRERERRNRLGIPHDVFLGRRGSFMLAPGLENFENGAKAKPQHYHHAPEDKSKGGKKGEKEKAKSDKADHHHGHSDKIAAAAAADDGGNQDLNATGGLVRRCVNFLGNEIVHHGSINDIAFAPSENRMASAGGDKLVKIWDPRDGTLVRVLTGHTGEVTSLKYSHDELYLVSTDTDAIIIIWDMTTNMVFKRLFGHADCITGLDMSPDCTLLVTSSYDKLVKSWYLTPRIPAAPDPPKVISRTDKTVILSWSAPPAFNLDITAFCIQWRVDKRNHWEPMENEESYTVRPNARSTTVKNLIAGTNYQFRIRAQNLMGVGAYSIPSKMTRTELGIPDKVEIPKLCGVSINTMRIYFFTPNPESFGGASQLFEVRYSGNGMEFDQAPIMPFTLQDAVREGQKVVAYFKDKLEVKALKIVQRKDKHLEAPKADMGFQIANEFMAEIISKVAEDPAYLLASVEIANLEPGFEYRIQVRGVNDEDVGPWSDASYSYSTHATFPRAPMPPFIEERTLTSIKFAWHAPDGRGTAIVGYLVQVKHTGKEFKLPRSQQWLEMTHLLPGSSYYIRIKSLNAVGESEWSEYNNQDNCHTLTDKPEQPSRPVAVKGTWCSLDVETRLPYNNGSPITEVIVHKRWVEAFNKGEWEHPVHMLLQEGGALDPRVEIIEFIAHDAFIKKLLEEELLEAEERKKGFNPFKNKNKELSLSEKLDQAKPEGSKLRLRVENLLPATLYEVRVSYKNLVGESRHSDPSHRAKTNAAVPPAAPSLFIVTQTIRGEREVRVAQTAGEAGEAAGDKKEMKKKKKKRQQQQSETKTEYYGIVTFTADFERQGGAHITQYVIQCRNNTVDAIELENGLGDTGMSAALHFVRFKRDPPLAPLSGLYFKVEDLVCGNTYQFRIRADNEGLGKGISEGVYSEWLPETVIPPEPEDEDDDEDSESASLVSKRTQKTEPSYVESNLGDDDDDDDLDLDLDMDVLNRQLPTTRKGAVLLTSTGKRGEVEKLKPKGVDRRAGVNSLEPGSF